MSRLHKFAPKGVAGLWVELTLIDGSTVDGVLETTDLRKLAPWTEITLRFGSDRRTYRRERYTAIHALGVLGIGRWSDRMRAPLAKGE